MALTRPRAYQIYDIDYKQAVRVITRTNIVLSAGAPNSVDGVNLSLNDRVLVAGQTNGAQNGIYFVTALGTGANGTWSRSIDTDTTGELLAGTIVMVTEGTVYADTQWKLITDNPIVIGTTPLIFEQNSAFAFGNIFANGTAVLANTVGDVVTFSAGNNISITGNNTSKTVTIGVTGISLNSISNGTSNVNVVSSGGNVSVGVGGTGNIAVFSNTGVFVTGVVSATGNITSAANISGGNILGNGRNLTGINTFSTISVGGQSDVVADVINDTLTIVAGTGIAITTNASTDTVTISTISTGTSIFETGGSMGTITESVTSSEDLGSITLLASISYDLGSIAVDGVVVNDNIAFYTITGDRLANNFSYGSNFNVSGNVTGGNVIATTTVSASSFTGNTVSVAGNVTGGNVIATTTVSASSFTGNTVSVTGNVFSNGTIVPNQDQVMAYIFAF